MSYILNKPILDQMIEPLDSTFFVDKSGSDSEPYNGTQALPYATIQKAVDEAATAGGGTVFIMPGVYAETVYIRHDNIHLVGMTETGNFGLGPCVITGNGSNPAVVITEATLASAQTWIARGASNYNTFYDADLVADAQYPEICSLRSLHLTPPAGQYSLVCAGVDNSSNQFDTGLFIKNCTLVRGLFARRVNFIQSSYTYHWLNNNLYEVGEWDNHHCVATNINFRYDSAETQPAWGAWGIEAFFLQLYGTLDLTKEGAVVAGAFNHLGGIITMSDDSFMEMASSHLANNVEVGSDASFTLHNCDLQGSTLLLDTGSGDLGCTLDGGIYTDIEIDDSNDRLTYLSPYTQENSTPLKVGDNQSVDGVTATLSLGEFEFTPRTNARLKFKAILYSSSGSLTASAQLYNVSDAEYVTSSLVSTTNTSPTTLEADLSIGSAANLFKDTTKTYAVRISTTGTIITDEAFLGSAFLVPY